MKEFIIKNLKWIILFVCLIGFLALAEDVFNKEIMNGDILGYKIISDFLISNIALIVITILLFICVKNKKIGISIFINLCVATGLNLILKHILQRPRPTDYRIINETGYSFPNVNSMISMAFYGFII